MQKSMKCIVVGSGVVGSKLAKILRTRGHSVVATATSKGLQWDGPKENDEVVTRFIPGEAISNLSRCCNAVDVAFVAIPTNDKGKAALDYINFFLSHGIRVVTAEKGTLAYHYAALQQRLDQIGYSATFGGGTDMLECLKRRHLRDHEGVAVKMVVNGTLNYILSGVGEGHVFEDVLLEAIDRGYAEPGRGSPVDKVNGELDDICLKASVFYNAVLAEQGQYLTPASFKKTPLTEVDLQGLVEPGSQRRYVLSVSDTPKLLADVGGEDAPGSLHVKIGRWTIRGGFQEISADTQLNRWLQIVRGVDNGFFIYSTDGEDTGYSHSGPGAGPMPTAMAMYRDARRLTEEKAVQDLGVWPAVAPKAVRPIHVGAVGIPIEDACDTGHRSPVGASHLDMTA